MRRLYKKIEKDNGVVEIFGSNRRIQVRTAKPEWSDTPEEYFMFRGHRYYLSEFERLDKNTPDWSKEFDGIHNETYSSFVLVKWELDEYGETWVKAFYGYVS